MTTKDISEKQRAYESLVAKRRKCELCSSHSTVQLVNPSKVNDGSYDTDEIGPWTVWQRGLNAKVMVIGKDFGPVGYFKENEGRDSTTNPTNKTVIDDVRSLGISIRHPADKIRNDLLFFTNSVLCLPEDTASDEKEMSFSICDDWIETCAIEFLRPLIEIVEPRAIITLGKEAFKGVAYAYSCHKAWGIRPCADFSLAKIVDRTPFKIDGNILVFPVFHPSYRHINRPAPKNTKDWAIIKGHLDKIQERA